jgi:ribose transport system substrate-binding protein
MKRIILSVLATLIGTGSSFSADTKWKIAVIPKGTTHVFWKSIEAGARAAEKEFGVEIIWKGPLKENDRAQQISIVEQFVSEGVDGIVLAPLDAIALKRPVAAATRKKIPVVIIDSALQGEAGKDFVSLVATDNRKAGSLGGEELARLLGGKGKVVLLRYQVGSASTDEREAGFVEAIKRNAGVQIIVDNRYAGATAGDAKTASLNLLDRLREADGVFCPNESSTFGMLLALRQHNLAGKIRFVGFDTSPPLVEALRKGEIQALVAQNPTRMGYEGVKTMALKLQGKEAPPAIDTGVKLITRDDLENPDVKALLGL